VSDIDAKKKRGKTYRERLEAAAEQSRKEGDQIATDIMQQKNLLDELRVRKVHI